MSTNARSSTAVKAMIGHDAQRAMFRRLAGEAGLHHAYLFFGDEGIGKFGFALELANFLESNAWEVPGSMGALTDALVVEPEEGEKTLGIGAVRALRTFLSTTPLRSACRTAIIRDAERLTREAESALLKIMEEPPTHALILVIARDPSVLFPPLASRMAKVYFRRFSRRELSDVLTDTFGVPAREAAALALCSFGRLGYALSQVKSGKKKSAKDEEALTDKLEALILARWGKGVRKEAHALAFLLSRLEAAARFNLNPKLQERAVAYRLNLK